MLLVAGWLVAAYGVLSQFGDPNPHTPAAVIDNQRRLSGAMLGTGNPLAAGFHLALGVFLLTCEMAGFNYHRRLPTPRSCPLH